MPGSSKPMAAAPTNRPDELIQYSAKDAPFWACEPDAEGVVRFAAKGAASEAMAPSATVMDSFRLAVRNHGDKPALRTENMPPLASSRAEVPPALPLSQWKTWTWREYDRDVRLTAKALMELGVAQHDTVSIFGFNAPEWHIGCLGAMSAGAKAAGIYNSDNAEQVQYKASHSDSAVALVDDAAAFNKFKSVVDDLPYLKALVVWAAPECAAEGDLERADGTKVKVLTFEALLALGAGVDDRELDARMAAVRPGHCCALIYTSGTTGRPKAVMISHDNLNFEVLSVMPLANGIGTKRMEERLVSFLPLSHIAGSLLDIMCPIGVAAYLKGWPCVHFARPYDLKAGTLGQRLAVVQPTVFLGVPRVWEKIAEKLQAIGAQTKGLKKKLSTAAKKRGLEQQMNQQLGGSGKSPSFGPLGIYKKLLGVIKGKLGLKECRFAFTGAAPMPRELLTYFGSLGINVNELYGMSESTGATTMNNDAAHEWGTVGFELPGVEVRVFKVAKDGSKTECPRARDIFKPSEEEQGEICYRGRHVMLGYMANPKLGADHVAEIKKKNAETIDEEGWLHSSDKGALSTRGMVKITGRYKELIIGAGGENIAPVPIEDAIKARMPFVANAIMVGDKRKFNIVLLTLKCVGASGELPGTKKLDGPAKEFGATIQEAVEGGKLVPLIQKALKAVGDDGDVTPSNAARIQKFSILPHDFSVATDELTSSLKLKRSVVEEKYAALIDALYASKDAFVPYSVVGSYDEEPAAADDVQMQGSFVADEDLDMFNEELSTSKINEDELEDD